MYSLKVVNRSVGSWMMSDSVSGPGCDQISMFTDWFGIAAKLQVFAPPAAIFLHQPRHHFLISIYLKMKVLTKG